MAKVRCGLRWLGRRTSLRFTGKRLKRIAERPFWELQFLTRKNSGRAFNYRSWTAAAELRQNSLSSMKRTKIWKLRWPLIQSLFRYILYKCQGGLKQHLQHPGWVFSLHHPTKTEQCDGGSAARWRRLPQRDRQPWLDDDPEDCDGGKFKQTIQSSLYTCSCSGWRE